jgi:hypothetical protein
MAEPALSNFDWKSGAVIYPTENIGEDKEWNVVITGDWSPIHVCEKDFKESPSGLYGDLLPILNDSDLGILNLEGVFLPVKANGIVKDGILISFPEEYVLGLTSTSLRLACLANNHTMDFGVEGLKSTLKVLNENNIQSIGYRLPQDEMLRPYIFSKEGYRLGILNVAEGEEGKARNGGAGIDPIDLVKIGDRLESLKQEVDFIIIIVHAGREYLRTPVPYIQELYHQFVDFGANLVVGHHPHVYQGVEIYKNSPIFYSLGNFLFYYESLSHYQHMGFFLKCSFQSSKIKRIQVIPYLISEDGLNLILGEQLKLFLHDLKILSDLIVDAQKLNTIWDAFADFHFHQHGLTDLIENSIVLERDRIWMQSIFRGYLLRDLRHSVVTKVIYRSVVFLLLILNKIDGKKKNRENSLLHEIEYLSSKKHSAAVLRNRFDSQAHRELFLTMLSRLMTDEIGQSPEWAKKLIEQWDLP